MENVLAGRARAGASTCFHRLLVTTTGRAAKSTVTAGGGRRRASSSPAGGNKPRPKPARATEWTPPEEKEARRVERQRLAAERAQRRLSEEAGRNAAVAKKVADALAAPPAETPSWMNARGTEIFKAIETVVSKHPKGDAVKKPPSAAKTANAGKATKGEKPNGKQKTAGKDAATEKPGATGTELFDQYGGSGAGCNEHDPWLTRSTRIGIGHMRCCLLMPD